MDLPQILEKSKYNGCCLSHLLTVHIKAYKPCENTMNFIRFLLANSTSLELLTFYIVPAHDHQQHQYSISSVGRELKQMARASKSAVVEFIDLSFDWLVIVFVIIQSPTPPHLLLCSIVIFASYRQLFHTLLKLNYCFFFHAW